MWISFVGVQFCIMPRTSLTGKEWQLVSVFSGLTNKRTTLCWDHPESCFICGQFGSLILHRKKDV